MRSAMQIQRPSLYISFFQLSINWIFAKRLYIHEYDLEREGLKLQAMIDLLSRINKANPGTIDGISIESLGYNIGNVPPYPFVCCMK